MSGITAQNTLDNSGLIKSPAGGGAWNFISKQTASSSGDLSFTSGIDSTYKLYLFTFNNIHPGSTSSYFQFNMSIDSGSNYNVAKTTTWFQSYHFEDDGLADFGYNASRDLAQGTGFQDISTTMATDNDLSLSGSLSLFAPSDTTFVKHFIARANHMTDNPASNDAFSAGYGNTTSAVDAIQFKMNTGNIDVGDICLYGLTT